MEPKNTEKRMEDPNAELDIYIPVLQLSGKARIPGGG